MGRDLHLERNIAADLLITATDLNGGKAVNELPVTVSRGSNGANPIGPLIAKGATGTRWGNSNYENYELLFPLVDPPLNVWWNNTDPASSITPGMPRQTHRAANYCLSTAPHSSFLACQPGLDTSGRASGLLCTPQ